MLQVKEEAVILDKIYRLIEFGRCHGMEINVEKE
jgi:hypothetical protein